MICACGLLCYCQKFSLLCTVVLPPLLILQLQMKKLFARLLPFLFTHKPSASSAEELHQFFAGNIVGFKEGNAIRKLVVKKRITKGGEQLFVLHHSYKKTTIKAGSESILPLPLEKAHLLNLMFKKTEEELYTKSGLTITCVPTNETITFYTQLNGEQMAIPYLHSLQNLCSLLKKKDIDFTMAL